ncbi:MAG: GNAT family N-acetyltransferase [Desulfobacteraceae bacterium]|nr:GNAT family N-acetyltransferase [Desulfobacteraceae bacterium]MBC2754470.1 GNAT family N-acetyltransferase [Desulfobacteraceae bacterium]
MILRPPVVTPRLLLKKESLNDFERFFAMSKDRKVMQFIGDGSIFHWTKKTAFEKFKAGLDRQNDNEFGTLAVYTKNSDQYIGWCGIRHSKFLDHIELGYRYCRDAWFNGYATEAATAILIETYRLTDIDRILACTHPQNIGSIRVLKKLGFTYAYSKLSRSAGMDIPVYRIDRKTFELKH